MRRATSRASASSSATRSSPGAASTARRIPSGPTTLAVTRSVIHTGHRMLYTRSAANTFGVLETPSNIPGHLLHGHDVPGVHGTSDRNLFAHLGRAVPPSREFYPRPEVSWDKFGNDTLDEDVQWELVMVLSLPCT
ncbi:uncharacterized protein B0H18DRAFT_1120442 [Fomitopsis serialis]|uniref:uncharacterized protein n=1 Tax=Fomitopsis serialis TaxID=139415 RepID=UPI0020081710|nr:uncharacterized protein B0H18DRAFT_1120442 [Neoantrodia serialis]KAH9923342.1 hypothetical protein B0H18DRAFT_1120442 [Neoantrodia serialis]